MLFKLQWLFILNHTNHKNSANIQQSYVLQKVVHIMFAIPYSSVFQHFFSGVTVIQKNIYSYHLVQKVSITCTLIFTHLSFCTV